MSIADSSPRVRNGSSPEFLALAVPATDTDVVESPDASPVAGNAPAIQGEIKRQPKLVTLQRGTGLTMRLSDTISSDRNAIGDTFRGALDSRLMVNGVMVAEKGSAVLGRIVYVKRAHLFHSTSDLSLTLVRMTTRDGQAVEIETSTWEGKAGHKRIGDTPRMAAGAAVGAVVGALSGAARGAGFASPAEGDKERDTVVNRNGRAVVLMAGMPITFRLAKPITVSARSN